MAVLGRVTISADTANDGSRIVVKIGGAPTNAEVRMAAAQRMAFET